MPVYVTSLSSPPLYNERSLVELQIVYHKSITLSLSLVHQLLLLRDTFLSDGLLGFEPPVDLIYLLLE